MLIRVNIQFQISRGNFVYGEILQIHTIRESNCTVIKNHVMETIRRKKLTKNN